jgi:two-component system, sensor histidine kinase LadS
LHPTSPYTRLAPLAWLMVLCCSWLQAATIDASVNLGQIELGDQVRYLEDPGGTLTYDDIRHRQDWIRNDRSTFSQGYSTSAWWLSLELQNPQPQTSWLLEFAYPVLDHLQVYVRYEDGRLQEFILGDKLPFWSRPIQHHNFLVPLTLDTGTKAQVYIRVESTSSLMVPIILWDENNFHTLQVGPTIMHGIYYGGLLIIALYNLLIYFVLGERAYLYYVSYIVSLALFVAGLQGWSFMFLWPNATQWNDQSILVFLASCILFAVLFTRRFLATDKPFQPWANGFFFGFTLLCCGAIVASFFTTYTHVISILVPVALVACVMGLIVGIVAWFEKRPSAPYYTLAWAALFAGGIVIVLSKSNVIPSNLFTEYALLIGSLLEALLLSFALAERINKERSLRIEAQSLALQTQRQANEALEQRVAERTVELEQANQKLKTLSDTDQLTGLKNRRYLNQYLEDEFARCIRYQHSIAILMIDIDHFKSVNDNYGHLAGDQCLKVVAEQIQASNRAPTDLAARYGGEEFCFVLPETDSEGATVVAQRVLQQIENTVIPLESGNLRVTCSVGLYAGIPNSPKDVNLFVNRADAALYQSKQNGRNCLTSFSEAGSD